MLNGLSFEMQLPTEPACIIKTSEKNISILRANERLTEELLGYNAPLDKVTYEIIRRYIDNASFKRAEKIIKEAVSSRKTEECEIVISNLRDDQPVMHVKLKFRLIEKTDDYLILSCILENNTEKYIASRRENELINQLRIIIQNFNGGITVSYDDYDMVNYIYANDQFYSMFGYTKGEFDEELSGNLYELILPEYIEKVQKTIRSSMTQLKSTQLEFRARKRDGSEIWIRSRNSFHYMAMKRQLAYITFYEDITNMMKIEERIHALNERLGSSEIFFQLDITNEILEAYRSIHEPENDFSQSGKVRYEDILTERVYADDKEEVKKRLSCARLRKYFDEGNTKYSMEYRRCMRDGNILWFAASVIMVGNTANDTVNAFIYCHNIDEKMKERIANSKILDTDVDDILIVNIADDTVRVVKTYAGSIVNNNIVYNYNEFIENFIETEVEKEDKERCRDFFILNNLVPSMNEDKGLEISYWIASNAGGNRRKHTMVSYLDNTHKEFLVIGRDITALFEKEKEQQMALKHAVELAEFANQAKSDFLSRMSHDMRTPLNAIIGLTELAKTTDDETKMAEYLRSIGVSGQYLLGLINDTLDLSKIESGKMELNREIFPLEDFILGINTVIKPLMDAKNIEFTVNLQDHVKNILVDKMRFNQVFYNLLSNASKYTPAGGRVEFSSESISPKGNKLGLRFRIKDNGIGMSKEFLKIIFDPFTQEYSPAHNEQKGTGLGLAIVKQIVDLAGGRISVKSEPGKGSEFIVDVYAHNVDSKIVKEKDTEYDLDQLRGIHVLLVDDTEINTAILEQMLQYKGCITDVAVNGLVALNMFKESEQYYYDVIMTDIRMPVMDGFEEARQIRALDRPDAANIPIIASTADAYDDIREKILAAGMNERLVKPVEFKILYETIVRLIEERQNRLDRH